MSKVFITDYILNPNIEKKILKNSLTNNINNKEISILLVWHELINKAYLNRFPKLKAVLRYGVGYDNIDLKEIKKRKLLFCNNPDYGINEVSDTALSAILSISRGIYKYNELSKNLPINWQLNTLKKIKRSSETIIGIIGAGRIGSILINKLNTIGYKTAFYDPYKEAGYDKVIKSKRVLDLIELAKISDIISIHCSSNDTSRGMINKKFILNMKKGSSLVNTARGDLIKDLNDFCEPLINNKIDSIFLDVLNEEPPKKTKFIEKWLNDKSFNSRIFINPHTSYYSKHSFIEMRKKISLNAKCILKNLTPENIIINASK